MTVELTEEVLKLKSNIHHKDQHPMNNNLISRTITLFMACALIISGIGCNDDADAAANVEMGSDFQGGIVAYIFQPGDPGYVEGEVHGLIAAKSDLRAQFGCRGSFVGGTGKALGTGKANTDAIAAFHDALPDYANNPGQCNEWNNGSVAAWSCRDYAQDGYNDWYLPSIDELMLLYENLHLDGKGDFEFDGGVTDYYVSSSDYASDFSYRLSFFNGEEHRFSKFSSGRVRPIRNF